MIWGKKNKSVKREFLYLAVNSGILDSVYVNKTLKHLKVLITPKFFVDVEAAKINMDSGSDSDSHVVAT